VNFLSDYIAEPVSGQYGCFVKVANYPEATIPMHIGPTHVDTTGRRHFHFGTDLPQVGEFVLLEGLQKVAQASNGVLAIPASWRWVPLGACEPLIEDATSIQKEAAAEDYITTVTVQRDDTGYSLGGPPLGEVEQVQRSHLKEADARFLLGALGVDNPVADVIFERVQAEGLSKVSVAKTLRPFDKSLEEVKTKVSQPFMSWLQEHVSPVSLIKEASIADPESVDAVLALGLITPDNLMAFLDHMQPLEDTVGRLAQMLIMARLGGLTELPEPALERSMKAIDRVLAGLKALRVRLESPDTMVQ
jgi:hypothetical protein